MHVTPWYVSNEYPPKTFLKEGHGCWLFSGMYMIPYDDGGEWLLELEDLSLGELNLEVINYAFLDDENGELNMIQLVSNNKLLAIE